MSWDVICVGGGLGGAALGRSLALAGVRTLVLERETRFRDRVRGEYLECWGAAEAEALGLQAAVREAGGHASGFIDTYIGPTRVSRRDFADPADPRPAPYCISHPAFQEAVLAAAAKAGAEVRRGATVTEVTPGARPSVTFRAAGGEVQRASARLVIGADGRDSKLRAALGYQEHRDPDRLCLAGLLLEGYTGPEEASSVFWNLPASEESLLFPRRDGVLRAYVGFRSDTGVRRLSGKERISEFLRVCRETGVPEAWLAQTRPAGPLAAFEGADSRIDHPYRDGVALVGDAAATSDPVWGCGMSLTLRDVRTLRDALAGSKDWDAACHAYADEHDRYYARLRTVEDWLTQIFFDRGPEADARRGRVFALALRDPAAIPDVVGRGPDSDVSEAGRRRAFAEEGA